MPKALVWVPLPADSQELVVKAIKAQQGEIFYSVIEKEVDGVLNVRLDIITRGIISDPGQIPMTVQGLSLGKQSVSSPQDILLQYLRPVGDRKLEFMATSFLAVEFIKLNSHFLTGTTTNKQNLIDKVAVFDLNKFKVVAANMSVLFGRPVKPPEHIIMLQISNELEEYTIYWVSQVEDKLPQHKNITMITEEQMSQREAAKLYAQLNSYAVIKDSK